MMLAAVLFAVAATSTCPCLSNVSAYALSALTANVGGSMWTVFSPGSRYGEFYGLGCAAHDANLPPFCEAISLGTSLGWCLDQWCWVEPTCADASPSYYFSSASLYYSYAACNATNSFDDFYTPSTVGLCSVFSRQDPAVAGANASASCGDSDTPAQVHSMASAINSLFGGRGFPVQYAGQALTPHVKFDYTWHTYAFGAWAGDGLRLTEQLVASAACDVVVGMGSGCPEAELQAQAALARAAGKVYFTAVGPRQVLVGAGNDGASPPLVFSTHLNSDSYADTSLELLSMPPHFATSVAVLYEPEGLDEGGAFYEGVGRGAMRAASRLGYALAYNATLRPPSGDGGGGGGGGGANAGGGANGTSGVADFGSGAADGSSGGNDGTFDVRQLEDDLARAAATRADVLVLAMRPAAYRHASAVLSELREPPPASTASAAPPHSFRALWWQGAAGASAAGGAAGGCDNFLADAVSADAVSADAVSGGALSGGAVSAGRCAFVLSGAQLSTSEALDAYGDSLLDGRTYRWLLEASRPSHSQASSPLTEPVGSIVDRPDGAIIPSLFAQAMQLTFRNRPMHNLSRPLADARNYAELLSTLQSGREVARTFYGPVRFDAFGQNEGRRPTAMQTDGPLPLEGVRQAPRLSLQMTA